MAGTVKVDTQKLRSTAGEFQSTLGQIRSITGNMIQTVGQLSGTVWSGDAATAYTNKFNGLQDEMQRIHKMVEEHGNDLQQMAATYEQAEQTIQGRNAALSSEIF